MTEIGKTEDDSSLSLMLRGHLLPRFGGARGTWELALLSTALTHMYVGLEDLRHHIRKKSNPFRPSDIAEELSKMPYSLKGRNVLITGGSR
jgi:hypothetical protein